MPQMAPLSWIFLYLMFTLSLLLFSSINYFNYNPNLVETSNLQKINMNSLNWMW